MAAVDLSGARQYILDTIEDEFIEGERDGARFHASDMEQIRLIDKMADGDEKESHYYNFSTLADYRHRNVFLLEMLSNFDEFIAFYDPDAELDREECKDEIIATQKLYADWIEAYKQHITELLERR